MRQADMEIRKGQNMVEHESEIFSRPARTWFQSEKEKAASKGESSATVFDHCADMMSDAGKATYLNASTSSKHDDKKGKKDTTKHGKYDGLSRRVKRRKMAIDADAEEGNNYSVAAAVRKAKKEFKPTKISEPMARTTLAKPKTKAKGKKRSSAFDDDKGKQGGGGHEGMRAKRVKVTLKKGGKTGGKAGGKGKGK